MIGLGNAFVSRQANRRINQSETPLKAIFTLNIELKDIQQGYIEECYRVYLATHRRLQPKQLQKLTSMGCYICDRCNICCEEKTGRMAMTLVS